MPLGIVSDEAFEKEVADLNAHVVPVTYDGARVVDSAIKGRTPGSLQVPDVLRKIIGDTALEEGSREAIDAIAGPLGISPSSVSAYKNGATSTATYNEPNKALSTHLDMTRTRIARRASKRLNEALNQITPEKLEGAKLRDVSAVAKDMSSIMKDMEAREEKADNNKPGVNIVFMAPRVKSESQYEVIQANE